MTKNNLQRQLRFSKGQMLVELMLAIGIAALVIPALVSGLMASREGRPQQQQRLQATALMKETETAVRYIRDADWNTLANATVGSIYSPAIVSNQWTLASGASTSGNLRQEVILRNINRDAASAIVTTGGTLDPSTKKADLTISWTKPQPGSITSSLFLTRTNNSTRTETSTTDFNLGTKTDVQVTNVSGGEIKLANNNKAKWCSPVLLDTNITLPDGPPVAVAATASAVATIPNDVYVATAPNTSSLIKLAHVNVTANTATPASSLRGKFTMDASQFASGQAPQSGTGLTNSFKTTDVAYYKSGSNTYALLGTDLPNKEVVAVWVNDGNDSTTTEFQDPVNKIYKYKTFFNTRQYNADARSTPNQDQSPYSYGASTIAVLGTRGYVASGGYLYSFNLSNIDSKTTSIGLDMLGCRIQLDGYECKPGSPATAEKYDANQTGASWGDDTSAIHNDCSDGGNVELLATRDIDPVQVGSNNYVFVAVGGVTNPEFEVVNTTTVPSTARSDDSTCGTASGGDATWKISDTLDFNSQSNTEEAANSVYAKNDGTRAYISSNGGIDGNGNGQPDSKQFYVINTSNKTNIQFLSGTSSPPTTGYYEGSGANLEMYPRRSLTVLDGDRAVLVGQDAISNGNNAQEYQVLNMETETTPTYCAGINYDQGFNDLTSVSEADYDNYVYMVTNTNNNWLKIIEGGPDDAIFVNNGTYESVPFNLTQASAFNRFLANVTIPTNTSLQIQTAVAQAANCSSANYVYVGPDGTSATKFTTSTSLFAGLIPLASVGYYQNPGQCFRYKLFLTTSDPMVSPLLQDITLNYSF